MPTTSSSQSTPNNPTTLYLLTASLLPCAASATTTIPPLSYSLSVWASCARPNSQRQHRSWITSCRYSLRLLSGKMAWFGVFRLASKTSRSFENCQLSERCLYVVVAVLQSLVNLCFVLWGCRTAVFWVGSLRISFWVLLAFLVD